MEYGSSGGKNTQKGNKQSELAQCKASVMKSAQADAYASTVADAYNNHKGKNNSMKTFKPSY